MRELTIGADSPPKSFQKSDGLSVQRISILLGVMAVFAVLVQGPAWTETPAYASVNVLAALSLALAGSLLWSQQRLRPLAIGCFGVAVCWTAQWLTTWNTGAWPLFGWAVNMWTFVFGGVGLIMTPRDRPLTRFDRFLTVAFFTTGFVQFGVVAVSRPEWPGYGADIWWPHFTEDYEYFRLGSRIYNGVSILLAVGFIVASARRIRRLSRMDQMLAVPVVLGFCCVGAIAAVSSSFQPYTPARQNTFFFLLSLIMMTIPLGFITSVFQRIIRRALLTEQLSRRLARRVLTGNAVQEEFRTLLGDDSLELFYWSERDGYYIDTDGRPMPVGADAPPRFIARLLNVADEPMAVVVGDQTLLDHMSMLESFLAASAIAIENVQLQASIKAQLEQVRASRARIVEATLEERRRIERDLHDGVQQRLLALQARIGTYRKQNPSSADAMLDDLSVELQSTLRSLRELAQGIHPTELRQFGLRGAIEVVAERLPLNIHIQIPETRFPTHVESTLYFVICEALTNIVKHAEASYASVVLSETESCLSLRVSDDGVGGASVVMGGGLEGVNDRLRSIGGQLTVSSSASGSRVEAEIETGAPA